MSSQNQLPFDFSLQNLFTFDDFVKIDSNSEILNAFDSATVLPEQFYFIWGEAGCGKSHLFQALCHKKENAVYVPLKKFAQHGAEILQGLEYMDIVCLDDLECVVEDKAWEEALFGFFNSMKEEGNKLIVSAQSSPRNLSIELADLASRLSWGMVYQLHTLAENEQAEALKLRVASRGIPLNDDVLDYILLRSPRGMGELCKVLDTLDKLSLAEKRRITIPFVKAMMAW